MNSTKSAEKTAWYLGCRASDVGQKAILIGDPARVDRIAPLLQEVRRFPEHRGLRTLSGRYRDQLITVAAFGMGAPIATIVLHELFDLGTRVFLRIGTAMVMPNTPLGHFLLAEGAIRREGTSLSYAPASYPATADVELNAALAAQLDAAGYPWRAGMVASFDGFYSELFALDASAQPRIEKTRREMLELGVMALDMETSAILTVARVLGARAGSLCLATVDNANGRKLDAEQLAEREQQLFRIALDGLTSQ